MSCIGDCDGHRHLFAQAGRGDVLAILDIALVVAYLSMVVWLVVAIWWRGRSH